MSQQRPSPPSALPGALLAALLVPGSAAVSASEPFVPKDDGQVVAQVRQGRRSAAERELEELQARLSQDRGNLELARTAAGKMIAQARIEADPRWLGRAETALAPWWTNAAPPPDVLVLRATLRQSLHDFPAALADLDAALARDPRNAQAWLVKASVLAVRADYDGARRACVPLIRLTDGLVATVAAGTVASLTGNAARSITLIESALAARPDAPPATKTWALTQLAESAERLGRWADADRWFTDALALAPTDPYLLGARADFLLDRGRFLQAAELLRGFSRIDGLLLRAAEARAAEAGIAAAGRAIAELDARFSAARERGDRVHLREEARFRLRLRCEPRPALKLARENWEVQKEPADARILIEAARAAGDAAAESEVLAWKARTGLEDVRITATRP